MPQVLHNGVDLRRGGLQCVLCERMSEKVWIDLVSEYSRTRSRDHHVHFAPVVTFTVSILKQVFARPAHPFLSESIRPAYWTHIDLLDCKHLGDSRAEMYKNSARTDV